MYVGIAGYQYDILRAQARRQTMLGKVHEGGKDLARGHYCGDRPQHRHGECYKCYTARWL